jgi:hypothetical protein
METAMLHTNGSPDSRILELPASIFQAPVEAIRLEDAGLKAYVVTVTPEVAKVWVARRHRNRAIHHVALAKLKHALQEGLWELNGEPLIFDADGVLIEGQHRCLACIETGLPFVTLIVHGINQDLFRTMGQGAKRTVGDILSILGKTNGRTLGAALRWVWRYKHEQMMNAHPVITEYEVAALETQHPTLQFSVTYGNKCHGCAAPAMIAALHYLCRAKDEDLAEYFYTTLASGAELPSGSPLLFLFRYLLPKKTAGRYRAVIRDERKAPVIINTWNLLRKDRAMKIPNVQRILWQGRAGQKYPSIQ